MGGKVAALQAHCKTLEAEGERWQGLWRSAAASNAQLTARVASLQDGQVRAPPLPGFLAPHIMYCLCSPNSQELQV